MDLGVEFDKDGTPEYLSNERNQRNLHSKDRHTLQEDEGKNGQRQHNSSSPRIIEGVRPIMGKEGTRTVIDVVHWLVK